MRQLALPFVHHAPLTAADFLAAPSNQAALSFLSADPSQWPSHRLWLWGQAGCGKTHLLHLWTSRRGSNAARLEAACVRRIAADGILPATGGLAIDDADQIHDDTALLHLLNIAAEREVPLVLASRTSPARLNVAVPDLASRLRATLTAGIEPPEDDLLDALLARLLADRQLAVSPNVLRFLRLRLPREPDALRQAAADLDVASLEGRRPITVPLAAALF